jgi:DNA-binding Lrp family transcriptional regulator
MSKSSKEQQIEDELKIVAELQKNCKENTETIAKHCGFTKQKVGRLIKQLEAKKLIWGYTAVFDEHKIGKTHFILMIKRSTEKIGEKVVDKIISTETEDLAKEFGITIESSAFIHGEYDWILTFFADGIQQAKKFSDKLMQLFPTGTQRITIMQTLMFIRKNNVLNPERTQLKDFI